MQDRGSQFWFQYQWEKSPLAQVLLARVRDGPSRFGMREFYFLPPFQSLLWVVLCSLQLGQHHTKTEGWDFHTPALGYLGLKPRQGKTKLQLFYSPLLCILWTKTVILIKLRFSCATQSRWEMFPQIVSTAEPAVLCLCHLPGGTNSKPLCTERCTFSAAAHACTFTICFPHEFEINISLPWALVQLKWIPRTHRLF